MQWTGTSGGHYHAAGLLFAHSMLGGKIGNYSYRENDFWQNEAN
jgi:hypothetical protein